MLPHLDEDELCRSVWVAAAEETAEVGVVVLEGERELAGAEPAEEMLGHERVGVQPDRVKDLGGWVGG